MGKTFRKEQRESWRHKKPPVKFSHTQLRKIEQLRKLHETRETRETNKEKSNGVEGYDCR